MASHADYPELATLPALLKTNRRLVAGQLRIVREEKDSRAQMDALLDAAGVDCVTCEGYLIQRTVRNGRSYATVTPIKD